MDSTKTDDTKERNKPELYVLGSNQIDSEFEKAILTMKKNETSKFFFEDKSIKPPAKKRRFINPELFGIEKADHAGKQKIYEIELLDFNKEQPYVSTMILNELIIIREVIGR